MSSQHLNRVFAGAAFLTTNSGSSYRGGLFRDTIDDAFGDAP